MSLIALAIVLIAHALGLIPRFHSSLEAALRSGQSVATPALRPALCGIAALFACLFLLAVLRCIETLFRTLRKPAPITTKAPKPLEEFLNEAAVNKISAHVARESYHLLGPHYPEGLCINLNDCLRDDLCLSDDLIQELETKLLTHCGREDASATGPATSLTSLLTVRDLLLRVETAAPIGTEQRPEARRPEMSPRLPGPDSRGPSSGQRKAFHAAALQAIESRLVRAPEASKLHRRSSDYDGPRRRVTDELAEPVYKGPYRRTEDLTGTSSSGRIA